MLAGSHLNYSSGSFIGHNRIWELAIKQHLIGAGAGGAIWMFRPFQTHWIARRVQRVASCLPPCHLTSHHCCFMILQSPNFTLISFIILLTTKFKYTFLQRTKSFIFFQEKTTFSIVIKHAIKGNEFSTCLACIHVFDYSWISVLAFHLSKCKKY